MIRKTIGAAVTAVKMVGQFFVTQWHQYTPFGQFLYVLAMGAIIVDASIAAQYGRSMSLLHAAGFAIVALCFCIFPDAAVLEARKKNWAGALGIAAACIPLGIGSFQSHIGYGAAIRLGDIQQTGFQHAKLDMAKSSVKSEEANIAMWREQLADLKKRNADIMAKNGGWVTSTDPTAAKKQLEAIDTKIENEAKRVKCGAKCEALKVERGNLSAYIANLTKEEELTGQINATQKIVDAKMATVANTGYQSSTVVNQNDTFAKLWNVAASRLGYATMTDEQVLNPTTFQRDIANTVTAGSASLNFMIAGPMLMLLAGLNRIAGAVAHVPPAKRQETADSANSAPVSSPVVNLSRVTVGDINREKLRLLLDRGQPQAIAA